MAGKLNYTNMTTNLFYSLITAIFVGGTAGYIGSLMVTKKMSLAGDALGHVALPGMGLALLFGFDVSVGALVFLLVGVLLIWFFESRTELPAETLTGVVFVLSLAVGFLITPELELLEALIGDISRVTAWGSAIAVLGSILAVVMVRKIYPEMILSSISEDTAISRKINIKKNNLIYFLALAIITALGVKVVGSLLIGALVIVPAAAARNVSQNMRKYIFASALLGVLICVFGVVFSSTMALPVGPITILAGVTVFVLSLIVKEFSLRGFTK